MHFKSKFLFSLGLLALLITGLWMMGSGLGEDFVSTSQQKSGWLTLFGLLICLVSGFLMTYVVPGSKDRGTAEDQLS